MRNSYGFFYNIFVVKPADENIVCVDVCVYMYFCVCVRITYESVYPDSLVVLLYENFFFGVYIYVCVRGFVRICVI